MRICFLVTLIAVLLTACPVLAADVVISQVYGAGGLEGSVLRHDFIELYNRGEGPVNIDGWSIQYGPAVGTTWFVTPLAGTIPPGGYYLVQEAAGPGGSADLPQPDASGTINLGVSSGKVALVPHTMPLATSCPTAGTSVDLVGYGSVTGCHEGLAGPAPGSIEPVALLRKEAGCTDTHSNANDFTLGPANPRNSASATAPCERPLSGIGESIPFTVWEGLPILLTVVVTPGTHPASTGIQVSTDLSFMGGPVDLMFHDDGIDGDAEAGDLTYSARLVFPANDWDRVYVFMYAELSDAQGRSDRADVVAYVVRPPSTTARSTSWGLLKRAYR